MFTEKDLLADIILNAPENAFWKFSYSWDKVVELFKHVWVVDNNMYSIKLTNDIRTYILNTIAEYNLPDWLIHQYIYDEPNNLLFESYDHMLYSIILPGFPNRESIISKYKDSELEISS